MQLAEAGFYISSKLQIIPLYPRTKKPMFKGWQSDWNASKVFKYFNDPEVNCGLKLGKIVDVEGDNLHANYILNQVIGNYPHPFFRSSKSVHHLFLNPDPQLTRKVIQKIEFRGYRHLSVIPPSVHPDGSLYEWCIELPLNEIQLGLCCPLLRIPEMPTRLKRLYFKNKSKVWIKPNGIKVHCGNNDCIHSSEHDEMIVNKTRFEREIIAFRQLGSSWLCVKCRRKAGLEIRPLCRKIKIGVNYE